MPDRTALPELPAKTGNLRGIGDDAEREIARLLNLRFTDPDDPALAVRRRSLAKAFERVPPERASTLKARLDQRRTHDPLSMRFWQLASATREQMLRILDGKTRQRRGTVTEPSPDISQVIDGIRIHPPEDEGPGVVVIRVDGTFRDLDHAAAAIITPFTHAIAEFDPDALVVASYHKQGAGVTPTIRVHGSIGAIAVWQAIGRLAQEAQWRQAAPRRAQEARAAREEMLAWARLWAKFGNIINPVPFTEFSEEGLEITSDPSGMLPVRGLKRLKLPKGAARRKMPRAQRGTAQQAGRQLYDGLKNKGFVPTGPKRVIRPNPRTYPTVEIHPNGEMFGSYKDLRKYLKKTGLTGGKKTTEASVEAHHLLEDEWTRSFGITRSEGRCVALEFEEHSRLSAEVPRALGRRSGIARDIDVIYEAHAEVYNKTGFSNWIPEMRDFLRDHRATIRRRYERGRVPGSKRKDFPERRQRVFIFLDGL